MTDIQTMGYFKKLGLSGLKCSTFSFDLPKYFCKIVLLILLWYSFSSLVAGEEDARNDKKALYLFPYEAITKEELDLLDSETRLKIDKDSGIALPYGREDEGEPTNDTGNIPDPADSTDNPGDTENEPSSITDPDTEMEEETGPKSLDTQIREAEGLLRRYYSQFLSEKRIWEDKNRGSKYSTRNEQNEVRLLIKELQSRFTETRLVRDSEIVYSLHKRLANLFLERENNKEAIQHFQAAYRYRNLASTEEYFLNEETWKEVQNEDFLEKRKTHKEIRDSFLSQEKLWNEEKKKIHRIGSDFAQGNLDFNRYSEQKKNQELVIENAKKKKEKLEEDYNESLKNNYLPYKITKSREDAENIYKLANLVRKSEEKNKERMKVKNKTSFAGRGVFVLFDYKRNTDFPAYEYLLEFSHRLDPDYLPVIRDVANQFKIDGKKQKAIDYYQKFIHKAELLDAKENEDSTEKIEREDMADAYLNLAILNSDIKRKVIAAEYYEKFLNTSNDEKKKKSIYFELGKFFQDQIGNLEKSKKYFSLFLNGNPDDKKSLTFTYYGLSLYDRKDKRQDREFNNLTKAYENYKSIRESLDEKEKGLVELEREINRYKRELLLTTNDEALAQFRVLQLRMEDTKLERDKIKSDFKSIPKTKILRRMAEISEENRNFPVAMQYYDELIDIGNEVEVRNAVKARQRIESTVNDGIIRKKSISGNIE